MMEFELPVLDASASLDEALRSMVDKECSGVAIPVGEHMRLLHFDAVQGALERGVEKLEQVTPFDAASLDPPCEREERWFQVLAQTGFDYGVARALAPMVSLLSAHEWQAGIYLSSPPATKCLNPDDPHYYPPTRRNPAAPNTCFCGFTIR